MNVYRLSVVRSSNFYSRPRFISFAAFYGSRIACLTSETFSNEFQVRRQGRSSNFVPFVFNDVDKFERIGGDTIYNISDVESNQTQLNGFEKFLIFLQVIRMENGLRFFS